jgi:hypothetical protein
MFDDNDLDFGHFSLDAYNEKSLSKYMSIVHIGSKALPVGEKMYRVMDAISHEYDGYGATATLCIDHIPIVKRTPKGAWVSSGYRKKFVLINGEFGRRFAYLTLKDALRSYAVRKRWQKHHGEWAIKRAEVGLDMLKIFEKKLEYAKNGMGPDV